MAANNESITLDYITKRPFLKLTTRSIQRWFPSLKDSSEMNKGSSKGLKYTLGAEGHTCGSLVLTLIFNARDQKHGKKRKTQELTGNMFWILEASLL